MFLFFSSIVRHVTASTTITSTAKPWLQQLNNKFKCAFSIIYVTSQISFMLNSRFWNHAPKHFCSPLFPSGGDYLVQVTLSDAKETREMFTCRSLECSPYFASLLLHRFIHYPTHLQDGSWTIRCQIQRLRDVVLICAISKWQGAVYLRILPGLLVEENKLPSMNSHSPCGKNLQTVVNYSS